MSNSINLQDIVKHIVNGTLEHNICRICLMPLNELYHNIYSRMCSENQTYCIEDVLAQLCNIKISNSDEYNICATCFVSATQAYKFYLMSRRSQEVIQFYVNEINDQLDSNIPQDISSDSLCITLPIVFPNNKYYNMNVNKSPVNSLKTKSAIYNLTEESDNVIKEDSIQLDTECVIILNENGKQEIYEPQKDGTLILVESDKYLKDYPSPVSVVKKLNRLPDANIKNQTHLLDSDVKKKKGRKRNPMEYKCCSRCPVRYRFVRKLQEHMKEEHGIDLFVCQVCQALIEDENEFNIHLETHSGIHTCSICNMVFKKRETIIAHFKWHEEVKAMRESDGAHVCEVCGLFFKDGEDLKEHHDKKHVKKFTCYYCGRMYKGEISFDLHIKKHEMNNDIKKDRNKPKPEPTKKKRRKFTCATCGRHLVDERALLWHERLHTNERPYVCNVCGRAFVSLNRCNQHAVCAHSAPARRCPLCPALFHLRSMVNTHIKKVHLKAHKRPNRDSKHQNVFWKTETVPIQELSVSIQNEILELQAAQTQPRQSAK